MAAGAVVFFIVMLALVSVGSVQVRVSGPLPGDAADPARGLVAVGAMKTASSQTMQLAQAVSRKGGECKPWMGEEQCSNNNFKRSWSGDPGPSLKWLKRAAEEETVVHNPEPRFWVSHDQNDDMYKSRLAKVFPEAAWLTTVRDPVQRFFSLCYWWEATSNLLPPCAGQKPCDCGSNTTTKLRLLKEKSYYHQKNHYHQMLWRKPWQGERGVPLVDQYDHFLLTEDFDRSVALVLGLGLGLSASELVYIDGKGVEFDRNASPHPPLEAEPEEVRRVVEEVWRKDNALDIEFHANATKRMQARFARQGPELEVLVREMRVYRARAEEAAALRRKL